MAPSTQPPDPSSGNSRIIACDFCGAVTRVVWLSNGEGQCGACHRVLVEADTEQAE